MCTPSVLEKRKSMKVDDSEEDDEIIIKTQPALENLEDAEDCEDDTEEDGEESEEEEQT